MFSRLSSKYKTSLKNFFGTHSPGAYLSSRQ
jgi:hypothetical protein